MRACLHRSSFPNASALILTALLFAIAPVPPALASNAAAASENATIPALGAAGPFDDVPLPFEPKRPHDEAGRDHLHALALFSTARALEQKNSLPDALRRYERAQRYDPHSRIIAQAVVELAQRLERRSESDRYLYRLVKLGGGDPIDVEELAFRTAMGGELQQAIEIYRRLIETRKDVPKEPIDVVIRWRLLEIHYLADQYKEAADCTAWVIDALENPQKFGLDKKLVDHLLAGPHLTFALFGEYCLLAGRPKQARAMFEKANEAAPNETIFEFRLARVDALAGRNEQALRRLESCLADPEKLRDELPQNRGPTPYWILAEVLESLGKKNELIPRLEKMYRDSPKHSAAGYVLAKSYHESSQLEKAEKLYKKLLSKDLYSGCIDDLMDIYRKQGRMGPLLDILGKVTEKTASIETASVLIQAASKRHNASHEETLLEKLAKAARQREKNGPKSLAAKDSLAVALLALDAKRYDLADEFFRKAIKAYPQDAAELIMIWSAGLLADDRNAQAVEVLRRGFQQKQLAEDDPIAYYYLATALAMVDKTTEAIAAAEKAAALKSDSPRFAAQQGWVLYRAKQYDRAAEINQEILKRFDSDQKNQNQNLRETIRGVRLALAGIEVNRGNTSRAEELLEEVLDEFPGDISALNDLGFLWADENRHPQRALRMTRKAVRAEPQNAAYLDSLGWALFRLGKYKEAAVEIEKALAIDPQEPEILEHLAEVYDRLKMHQKAKDYRRRAVDLTRE